jgi:pentatricopeptide repeat protein
LERLREDDSIPKTKPLFLALMRSTGRARQPTLLFRVFEELKAERIEPDTGVYTTLLNAARLWSVQREHAELLPDRAYPRTVCSTAHHAGGGAAYYPDNTIWAAG